MLWIVRSAACRRSGAWRGYGHALATSHERARITRKPRHSAPHLVRGADAFHRIPALQHLDQIQPFHVKILYHPGVVELSRDPDDLGVVQALTESW